MNREIRKKMYQVKKEILKANPTEKQIKLIDAEINKGLSLKEASKEAGITQDTAYVMRHAKKGYIQTKRPLIELLNSVAELASARLDTLMRSNKHVGARDTAYVMDVSIKNNRLLKGESTENTSDRINFYIPEYNVSEFAQKGHEAIKAKSEEAGKLLKPTACEVAEATELAVISE